MSQSDEDLIPEPGAADDALMWREHEHTYGHLFRSENHGLDVIVRDIFAAEPERPKLSSPAHVSRRVKW